MTLTRLNPLVFLAAVAATFAAAVAVFSASHPATRDLRPATPPGDPESLASSTSSSSDSLIAAVTKSMSGIASKSASSPKSTMPL